MDRLILVVCLVAVATVIAILVQRRRPGPPTGVDHTVPTQLDRNDFDNSDVEWLVVVFSSSTCASCAGVVERAGALESRAVAVQDVEVGARKDLHDRYKIDAVPTLVIADREGVVRASFIGPVNASDLWGTMAELREPGSVPPGCERGKPEP